MIDRAVLLERRAILQIRRKRREQSETFRKVAPVLCAAGVRVAKRPPVTLPPLIEHINAAPGRDERLYWPDIAGHCQPWSDPAHCSSLVAAGLAQCALPTQRVVIIFHPAQAALSLTSADAVKAWPLLHPLLFDTIWIVAATPASWVVEVSFLDREVCYAKDLGPAAISPSAGPSSLRSTARCA